MIAVVEPQPAKADDWYAELLLQTFLDHAPMRTLVLSGQPVQLSAAGVTAPCSVRTARGSRSEWHTLQASWQSLPFQVDTFDLVVLHHCVSQGDVRALAAVRRCMPVGSQLLVLGQAWFNPQRLRKGQRDEPAVRTTWMKRRLDQLSFDLRGVRGRGVAGMDLVLDRGAARLLQPCAEQLAFRARRRDARNNIRLVRFSTPRVVMGQGVAWEGANREFSHQLSKERTL